MPYRRRQNVAPLLTVENLRTSFFTRDGEVKAVDGVSFTVETGSVLGLVGESGCGKSVTALSILRLVPDPPGRIVDGRIVFNGRDLLDLSAKEMRRVRGNEISMIFQEPMTSLNPVYTVGNQIMEAILLHQKVNRRQARAQAVETLKLVGIPLPERRIDEYPSQLSGGMRQRVMIAIALSCNPRLLIADEPTTALDVTIQAQILELIVGLQEKIGLTMILITHDLGVISKNADQVAVMYAGKIAEYAPVRDIFRNPLHPYTVGLIECLPLPGSERIKERLKDIPGMVPNLLNLPPGCNFQDRCSRVEDICHLKEPPLEEIKPGHLVACFKAT
jgi:peptide/nickel transport system ATP-binding protein